MEFRILGPLEVRAEGQTLPLGGRKQRAVLAELLLNANQVVSSDGLIDGIWGEQPPRSVKTVLQTCVSNLRKLLEPGREPGVQHRLLVTRSPGYLIQLKPEQLDLYQFETLLSEGRSALAAGEHERASRKLRDALALWRGPALADLAYEPVIQPSIRRLEELRLTAVEDRIEAELALGRLADLVGELEQLVVEFPLRERLRFQLMLALYRSGRQAEALDVYQQTRRVLVDELGIEPGETLQGLERAILQHDASLELARPVGTSALPSGQTGGDVAAPERSILLVPGDLENLPALLTIAEPLSRQPRREIIVTALVPSFDELDAATAQLQEHAATLAERGISARTAAFTSGEVGDDLVRLSSEQDVDLLLTDAPPDLLAEGTPSDDLQTVLEEAPCDVASLVIGQRDELSLPADRPIIVPFGGARHEWAAVELGAWIAAAHGATLRLLGSAAKPARGKRDASRLLARVSLVVQRASGVSAKPLLVPPGEHGILEATRGAGLLIIGLSDRWSSEGLGPLRLALAREAKPPTLIVRRGLRPGGLTPLEDLTRYTWSLADGGG